jgi:hypothetical protein
VPLICLNGVLKGVVAILHGRLSGRSARAQTLRQARTGTRGEPGYAGVPNLARLETLGGTATEWLRLTVDSRTPEVRVP